eukprot:TRINITY_DN5826_c0_g1_i1.p1 TRINITY_DN5826_c0_g1~~TRINITY_DN5826_c0_g1_i1.p1  ORF type:complete len:1230 (-),score=337.50 TRINITY_DN5826_c0_g1_i1:45-3272(-)
MAGGKRAFMDTRMPSVTQWLYPGLEQTWYADVHGDRNNVLFQTLLEDDIPEFTRKGPVCLAKPHDIPLLLLGLSRRGGSSAHRASAAVQAALLTLTDSANTRGVRRYTSVLALRDETSKSFKRVNLSRSTNKYMRLPVVRHLAAEALQKPLAVIPLTHPVIEQLRQQEILERKSFLRETDTDAAASNRETVVFSASSGTTAAAQQKLSLSEMIDADPAAEDFETYVQRRSRALNEQTRLDPHNVISWKNFVDFQGEVAVALAPSRRGRPLPTAVVQKQLDILRRALKDNPHNDDLILAYLYTAAKISDNEEVVRWWEDALVRHPKTVRIWLAFLEFRAAQFSAFSATLLRSLSTSALQSIRMPSAQTIRGARSDVEEELYEIVVFLRSLMLDHSAGYTERAMARIQAVLEISLVSDEVLSTVLRDERALMRALGVFWETRLPRVGEQRTVTLSDWCRFTANQQAEAVRMHAPREPLPNPEISSKSENPHVALYEKEVMLEQSHFLPSRHPLPPGIDEDLSDPDRRVSFSDISDSLFVIQHQPACVEFILSLIEFCGLEFTRPLYRRSSNDALQIAASQNNHQHPEDFLEFLSQDPGLFRTRVRPSVPLADLRTCLVPFFRNVIASALVRFPGNTELLLASIRLEELLENTAARKLCKGLLKKNPNNLFLWAEYAILENSAGNFAESTRVFETALSMAHQLPQSEKRAKFVLCMEFSMQELRKLLAVDDQQTTAESQSLRALRICSILSAAVEDAPYTPPQQQQQQQQETKSTLLAPTRILKTRKAYTDSLNLTLEAQRAGKRAQTLSHTDILIECGVGVCHGIFEYIVNNGNIQMAMSVFDNYLSALCGMPVEELSDGNIKKRKLEQMRRRASDKGMSICLDNDTDSLTEYFLLHKSWLLYMHGQKAPFPFALLRQNLSATLALYPRSIFSVSLLITSELRAGFPARLHRFFSENVVAESCVALWVCWLQAEAVQPHSKSRVEQLIERAISENTHASNWPAVWRFAMRFFLHNKNRDAAKRTFFRAVHRCPWAKTLWLHDAVNLLGPGVLESAEIDELLDLMREKELRLRTDWVE